MDVLCTFKINIGSQNWEHGSNRNQSQEPLTTFKVPNQDMDVLCTFKINRNNQIQIKGASKTNNHIKIKIKISNHSLEQQLSLKI